MKNIITIFLFIIILLFTVNGTFAVQKHLRTEEVRENDVQGVFTLILYGGRYIDDIETIAFLDYEGDEYTLKLYAPQFDFKIKKGMPEKEALKEAYTFVSFHNSFYQSQLSRIMDDKGKTSGFELRPLYMPFTFGVSDVLEVDYWLKDGTVKVTIRIQPSVERALIDRTLVSDK